MGDDLESMGKVKHDGTHLLVPVTYEAESGGLLESMVRQSWQDKRYTISFYFLSKTHTGGCE